MKKPIDPDDSITKILERKELKITIKSQVLSDVSMKVLIIDDNKEMIEMMQKFLELESFDVKIVNNPALAVETITNNEFDKIILDLAMPEISGIDILNSLPSDFPKNKFVILTASSITDDFEEELKKTGISGVLRKPVSMSVLIEALKNK